MQKILIISIIALLLISTALAGFGGSSGDNQQRMYDPYGRQKYFGEGYKKPLLGYGLKDAPSGSLPRLATYGAKGATGNNPLLTNTLIEMGRSPKKVSYHDAGYRGYRIVDKIVELEPFQEYKRSNLAPTPVSVIARIFSRQKEPVSELPKSSVIIQAKNLPYLNDNEVYEAWLFDEESGYALSLGFIQSTIRSSASTSKLGMTGGHGGSLATDGTQDLSQYDTIAITKEPFPDPNPHPGQIIMLGDLT